MGQRDICCVKGCKSRRYRHKGSAIISYFKVPLTPPSRREAWIKFSRRKTEIKKSWKICSNHFVKGKPSLKVGDIDYIPSRKRCRTKKHNKTANNGSMVMASGDVSSINILNTANNGSMVMASGDVSSINILNTANNGSMVMASGDVSSINILGTIMADDLSRGVSLKQETVSDGDNADQQPGDSDHNTADQSALKAEDDQMVDNPCVVKSEPPEYNDDWENPTQQPAGEQLNSTVLQSDVVDLRTGEIKPDVANTCSVNNNDDDEATDDYTDDAADDDDDVSSSDEEVSEKRRTQGLCMICSKDFKMPCRLRTHMMTHTGERRPKKKVNPRGGICPICGKVFKRRNEINHHIMRVHEEVVDQESICGLCGKVLASKSSVRRHMKSVHATTRDHMCTVCDKTFTTSIALKKHLPAHNSEKQFICSTCADGFKHMSSLIHHEYTVHGDNTSCKSATECPVCGQKFVVKSRLRLHMETHNTQYYQCKLCDKQFRYKANLSCHMKGVHEGDVRYECPVCERKFGNSYNLKVHIRIHTGEKPYTCPNCKKGFADVCNFRRHEMKCPATPQRPLGPDHGNQTEPVPSFRMYPTPDQKIYPIPSQKMHPTPEQKPHTVAEQKLHPAFADPEDFMIRYRHPMYKEDQAPTLHNHAM